jgi:hypothetical protein
MEKVTATVSIDVERWKRKHPCLAKQLGLIALSSDTADLRADP